MLIASATTVSVWYVCISYSIVVLTYLHKRNSRTARGRDIIFSLINVASSWDVPFHQPQQLQCLHHDSTFVPLCVPVLSLQPCKVKICSERLMASVWCINIEKNTSQSYNVMKWVWHYWNWSVMAFTHQNMEHAFHE